jgi:predicted RecB family endonuclease
MRERLDRLDSRLTAIERQPSGVALSREADRRITSQAENIDALRLQMGEYRQRIAVDIETIEKRIAEVTKTIPAMLESIVTPKVDDLRLRLRSEMQQSVTASLTTFERAIDDKVSDRIAALERAMLEQSALVTALSQRAVESDLNLQRLISAVERLCDRPGLGSDAHPVAA